MNAEVIQALNLIEIDFAGNAKVVDAWHAYFENLNIKVLPDSVSQQDTFARRRNLYVLLLDNIAKALGYKFQQIEILQGGYYPDGAAQVEAENQAVRQLFASISRGERGLPIEVVERKI